jgi:hypothetical protein
MNRSFYQRVRQRSFPQLCDIAIKRALNWTGSHDYQAPSLSPLPSSLESFFPFMARRRPFNPWVRHTGRYDRRYPGVGFVTLDETAILFNYGLSLEAETVIEIGCWVGWSTVAWALSGAHVVAIDPVLNGLPQGESCMESLAKAGMLGNVEFIGDYSQQALRRLAGSTTKARAIFIDGDHEGDAPLRDAADAQPLADRDCLILLHDMVLPDVGRALSWLEDNGWNCGIHYTSQFLGVAWRGATKPLRCEPDPRVNWTALVRSRYPHLQRFRPIE